MSGRENMRKGRRNGNLMLLVMIGFCILAIIEILYGQAQIRMQKERLSLEQENHRAVQELKAEWDQLKGDPNVGTQEPVEAGEKQEGSSEPEKTLTNTEQSEDGQEPVEAKAESDESQAAAQEDEKEYDMQVVFLGDSILDNEREDHGVAALISDACNAKVYNMSMGGTTAALLPNEQYNFATWDSRDRKSVV